MRPDVVVKLLFRISFRRRVEKKVLNSFRKSCSVTFPRFPLWPGPPPTALENPPNSVAVMPRANRAAPPSPAEASDRGRGAAKPGLSLPERSSQIDESGFSQRLVFAGAQGRRTRVTAKARRRHRRRHSADGLNGSQPCEICL